MQMTKECTVPACASPVRARGWCENHYRRWKRYGDPEGRPIRPTPLERLAGKIDRDGPMPIHRPDLGPCWLWTAAMTPAGYGKIFYNGRVVEAHRVAYELLAEPIPRGLVLDHLCRVRACVNPHHLEPVTHSENLLRGIGPTATNAAKTHCVNGHPYTPENTYRRPSGTRECRACITNRDRGRSR